MKRTYLLTAIFLLAVLFNTNGQTVKVPSKLDAWNTVLAAKPVQETYMGKPCLRLDSGMIVVKGAELRDGTIEADISFSQERSFPGFAVRMQDTNNFENFYLRPHQSGNPDATQYTPEFNGQTGFQLYYGEGYDGSFSFRFNQWHHIEIELHGLQAEFYIDDTPVIKVKELLTGWKTGKIAIGTDGAPLRIANVQYTVKQQSAPSPPSVFEKVYYVTTEIKKKLTWTTQTTEPSGTINLARFGGNPNDTGRTIVTRLLIESASDQVKELSFGFSDYIKVYLNDKALYYGGDKQYSRDYRFLGTIGYFDRLFLPLKKGINELWLVVSEDFGGWGVKAKFENIENILLK